MKLIVPDYYKNFKCIAEKCKNSCCIGWEIDLDSETLVMYLNILGKWRDKFKKSIAFEDEPPHFINDKKGRCPFLNENGLCDIITELGEDALCQICYDHPRFHNHFSDRIEMGLGLCCEAAAELILNNPHKPGLMVLEEFDQEEEVVDQENLAFLERDALLSVFQNRKISLKKRMEKAAELYGLDFSFSNLLSITKKYLSLERLNPEWDLFLDKTESKNPSPERIFAIAEEKIPLQTEQLFCYFIYRYFAHQALLCNQKNTLKFILEATYFCLATAVSYYDEVNAENFTDLCRRFSLEVEYSEENVTSLLN